MGNTHRFKTTKQKHKSIILPSYARIVTTSRAADIVADKTLFGVLDALESLRRSVLTLAPSVGTIKAGS